MLKQWRKRYKQWRKARKPLPPTYARLPEAVRDRLATMYAWAPQLGSDGALHEMDGHTRIDPNKGCPLFDLWTQTKPDVSLETGLAYGFSTLYVLGAMLGHPSSRHIAIDPFQNESYHGIGAQQAGTVGLAERFTFYEESSLDVLPRLHGESTRIQFAFIDGDHRFDGAFVDFTLAAQMLDEGGVVLFDDLWMPSLRKTVRFIRRNREDFTEIPTPARNLAAFRRTGSDTRDWRHYVGF